MKTSLGAQTLIYPHPIFLVGTYDTEGKPNIMTAAWGGICCSRPPCVSVSLRNARYSYANIVQQQAFTISIPSQEQVKQADYAGIYSGRNKDKFKEIGFTPIKSEKVNAPYVAECPVILECRLAHTFELGLHTQFVGEILDVKAEQEVVGANGLPDILKVKPLLYSFSNQSYFSVGELVAPAFSVGK